MKKLFQKGVAEFLGTFVLVLFGTGVAVMTGGDRLVTALAFGLSVVLMAFAVGHISGGHFNPAVSLTMFLKKKLSTVELGVYSLGQLLGAIAGSGLLVLFLGSNAALGANTVSAALPQDGFVELLMGGVVEMIMTFIFMFAILGATRSEKTQPFAGLIIGLSLVVVILFGFDLTGVGVNPVRSLAPALFQGGIALEQSWVFIVFPLLGSVLAAHASDQLDF
ncbi:aquaporin [Acholeplasma vituli]|uniref:Aquaporin n=1 Tax=Paracholeplasma vituli TaxID=69473 RepID=A0ABT2Q024_9MOLU|nr:aquaporin [Paracholeplasma vituli]MCU0105263.1 aquaporin [Paracholeplasma vituli]